MTFGNFACWLYIMENLPDMMPPSTAHEALPPFCPICGLSAIRRLDLELLRNESKGEFPPVGGVQAFLCTVNQHIFFVRVEDLAAVKRVG